MSPERPKNNPESFGEKAKAWIENTLKGIFEGGKKYQNAKLQELWDSAGKVKEALFKADKTEEFAEVENKINSLEGMLTELEELYAEAENTDKWTIEAAKRRDELKSQIEVDYQEAFSKVCDFCETYAPHAKPAGKPKSFFENESTA